MIKFRMTERVRCTATITLSISLRSSHLLLTFIVKTGVVLSIWHCCTYLIFLLTESISGVPAQNTRDGGSAEENKDFTLEPFGCQDTHLMVN